MSYLYQIHSLSLYFPNKTCFKDFSALIHSKDRIALLGDNGSGKTSLAKILMGKQVPTSGSISPEDSREIGYLSQNLNFDGNLTLSEVMKQSVKEWLFKLNRLDELSQKLTQSPDAEKEYEALFEELVISDAFSIENRIETLLERFELSKYKDSKVFELSGGELMRLKFAQLLILDKKLLILDEPTNHLDSRARKWLFEFISNWDQAMIIITHDLDLLKFWPQKIWNIENGKIEVFSGNYDHFLQETQIQKEKYIKERERLVDVKEKNARFIEKEKEHKAKMAKMTKKKYDGDKFLRKAKKGQAERTMGRHHIQKPFEELKEAKEKLSQMEKPKEIKPMFQYESQNKGGFYIRIEKGSVGYQNTIVLKEINFYLEPRQRVAIKGANGSGKTTFMKALLNDPSVFKEGHFDISSQLEAKTGYLDQNHQMLDLEKSVKEHFDVFDISEKEIQRLLQSYLFFDFRILNQKVELLSGGEKTRLCLAILSLKTPELLILDEVTNNLDLKTKNYLIEVLNEYRGALLINSHEESFLKALNIDRSYSIEKRVLKGKGPH